MGGKIRVVEREVWKGNAAAASEFIRTGRLAVAGRQEDGRLLPVPGEALPRAGPESNAEVTSSYCLMGFS